MQVHLWLQEVHITHHRPAGHQLDLQQDSASAARLCAASNEQYRVNSTTCQARRTRWAVKDCRLEFQKASTKILLYLIATGQTTCRPCGAKYC